MTGLTGEAALDHGLNQILYSSDVGVASMHLERPRARVHVQEIADDNFSLVERILVELDAKAVEVLRNTCPCSEHRLLAIAVPVVQPARPNTEVEHLSAQVAEHIGRKRLALQRAARTTRNDGVDKVPKNIDDRQHRGRIRAPMRLRRDVKKPVSDVKVRSHLRHRPRAKHTQNGSHSEGPNGVRLHRRSEIRILFVFDPWRSAILLIGGDKAGNWKHWYAAAIPEAERLYAEYLEARRREEEQ